MNRLLSGVALLVLASLAHADPGGSCTRLLKAALQPPAGATSLAIDSTTMVAATADVPQHCLVLGHLDAEIHFNLALPTAWNGKMLMEGSSGFAGYLPDLGYDASLGYAAAGTDLGQSGDPADMLNRPNRIANLQYRGTHLVALAARAIIRRYYDAPAQHAYFAGCSRGGSQAMNEAARYPADFDGIIAAAPNHNNGAARVWNEQAVFPGGPANSALISSAKVALLGAQVLKKCDRMDGMADGIVADPRACNFSPQQDLPRCRNDVDGPSCFTRAQIAALQKIHNGPYSNGRAVGAPFYFSGNEGYNYGDAFGVGEDILDYAYNVSGFPENALLFPDFYDIGIPSFDYWLESSYLRYIVFNDPEYQLQDFNFDNPADLARYNDALAPQAPPDADLSRFGRSGGKLIMWHGLADSVVNSELSREFYEAGVAAMGGLRKTKSFDRLFLVPGALHCGGGPGPWWFNSLQVLEQWAEQGHAPKFIEGYSFDTDRSQPICAYPKQARLTSPTADPSQLASYQCVNVSPTVDDVD